MKPPVLSENELNQIFYRHLGTLKGIAQAQRDADVEWYEGRKKKPNLAEQWVITEVSKIKQETAREIGNWLREGMNMSYEGAKDYAEGGYQYADGYRLLGLTGQAFQIVLEKFEKRYLPKEEK